MIRKIIRIDEAKCNGCGACARACHEGAIAIVEGKAKLMRDDYCDGMGDCLPQCPTDAITFEEREAVAYSAQAVAEHEQQAQQAMQVPTPSACPGAGIRELKTEGAQSADLSGEEAVSRLRNWPIQLRLSPVRVLYFHGAELLLAADCTAYACAAMHAQWIRGRVTLIGCPKLDGVDYSEKLTEIFRQNDIVRVTVLRMEVPCCGGMEMAAKRALQRSGKEIPCEVVTISIEGKILGRGDEAAHNR